MEKPPLSADKLGLRRNSSHYLIIQDVFLSNKIGFSEKKPHYLQIEWASH